VQLTGCATLLAFSLSSEEQTGHLDAPVKLTGKGVANNEKLVIKLEAQREQLVMKLKARNSGRNCTPLPFCSFSDCVYCMLNSLTG
jgi:hypothetical protein